MEKIDEIYEKLAQEIIAVVESDHWSSAKLEFELAGDGVVGYTGAYTLGEERLDIDVENIDDGISDWLVELHEITTSGGNNRWNRSVFALTPDGKFKMEFIWDQELYDEIERLRDE